MSTYKSWLEKTKKQINKTYDTQKEQTENIYDRAINQTSSDAESSYRQNEVDRIFNEKKIAEINANLGLTNSGLNRTQQTAVQLSHSNRDYEISKARQEDIDNIALEKAGKVAEIENNRQNDLYKAKESYDSMVSSAKVNKVVYDDGGLSKNAIKYLQKELGLSQDGVIGAGTWNAIQKAGFKSTIDAYKTLVDGGTRVIEDLRQMKIAGAENSEAHAYIQEMIASGEVGSWAWTLYNKYRDNRLD